MDSQNELVESQKIKADKPLRLALIASESTISNYSLFLKYLLVGLVDQSIPTVLICPPNCDVDSVISPSVEVIRYPAFQLPLTDRINKKILAEKLDKFKPSVLHCLCETKLAPTRHLAKHFDKPYILNINSLQKPRGLSAASKHMAKIITPSTAISDSIIYAYPQLASSIELINTGIFTESKCNCFARPNRIASLLTARRIDNADEFENLLGAVRQLLIADYDFMLVIIGSGPAEPQLRKLLKGYGISRNVIIVPKLPYNRSILSAADIFIQPWISKGFNTLLLEAMSIGCAVAACNNGIDDLVIDNKTALVFDPKDPLSIHDTIKKLLDSREVARKIASQAQDYLRENHSVSQMITSILQIYRDAS